MHDSFPNLIDGGPGSLIHDTLQVSIPGFWPELVLCGTIVVLLLAKLFRATDRIPSYYLALIGSAAALVLAALGSRFAFVGMPGSEIFTGLLVYDHLTVFFRSVLLLFAVLFVVLTRITGFPPEEDSVDFYALLLGATVGMCLMVSANHLALVFLGVEMASVPSFVLAGMVRRRRSSEAAIKYAVYSAGAAGVMLYGISLLCGALGTAHLPTMAVRLSEWFQPENAELLAQRQTLLVLGGLMVFVGLAFKLSAVPFHFWCPDVFEGATAEVNAFLSVASKAAALGLLIRVTVGLGYVPESAPSAAMNQTNTVRVLAASYVEPAAEAEAAGPAAVAASAEPKSTLRALAPVRSFLAALVGLLAAVTCTFGNLTAYGQTNIKRLMAYSTIGHAGYMMMPVAAAILLIGQGPDGPQRAQAAIGALGFYVAVYLFMNLGAFAIIALLRNELHSEEIEDYAGLIRRAPLLTVCMSIILFSLVGLPPLAGFAGKFLAFAAVYDAGLLALLFIGAANTAISLFYYVRVIRVMTMEAAPEGAEPLPLGLWSRAGFYTALVTAPVLVLGVWWDGLNQWSQAAAALF